MDWQFTPYAVPLYVGAAMMVAIAITAWRRRPARGALLLSLVTSTTAVYILGYAFELSSTTLDAVYLWVRIEYIGIALEPMCLFLMLTAYTGHRQFLTPLSALLMASVPVMTIVFAWTNHCHELIWQDMVLERSGALYFVDFSPGPWYWVNIATVWGFSMAGLLLLARVYRQAAGLYRRQITVILVASALPLAAHLVYLSGVIPVRLDLTAYALIGTGWLVAWGIFDYQFLDIMPIARQAVVENLQDAVIVVDSKNRIVDLNPAAWALAGPNPASAVGRPVADVFETWLAPPDLRAVQSGPVQTEVVLSGFADRVFDVRLSPLVGRSGSDKGYLAVMRDITARKQVEDERERLIAELDAFAHTVAHDLKSPLTVLVAYSLLLQEDSATLSAAQIDDYVGTIALTSQKMSEIVDALLLLASVDKLDASEYTVLDMPAIVAQACHRLSAAIAESGGQVSVPDVWPESVGYAPWIEEVWVNYLSNALKYGGDPPQVTLGAAPAPGGMVRFWVQDNGPGLTPGEQAMLFTPFTRLHKGRVGGHGLGLSIVRQIVEQLGGEVGVSSEPRAGSVFSFTLPAKDAAGR